jgi:hypothetical protein
MAEAISRDRNVSVPRDIDIVSAVGACIFAVT